MQNPPSDSAVVSRRFQLTFMPLVVTMRPFCAPTCPEPTSVFSIGVDFHNVSSALLEYLLRRTIFWTEVGLALPACSICPELPCRTHPDHVAFTHAFAELTAKHDCDG
eukprot:COSAG02_NODE_1389_length_12913_cov_414.638889_5_plen_108_part_00